MRTNLLAAGALLLACGQSGKTAPVAARGAADPTPVAAPEAAAAAVIALEVGITYCIP